MFSTAFLDLPALQGASGTVTLPGSKSISNRVLLLSALCQGTTVVHDLLDSDDTRVMLAALRQLGCGVEAQGTTVTITGLGGRVWPTEAIEFFMGNAGTAMRPLTAALAVQGGDFTLKGVPRMHERPIGDLVDALRQLGCQIDYLGNPGYPPLRIAHAQGVPALALHQPIQVRGDVSSQFLTALLMALPLVATTQAVHIEVVGELISKPYIAITLQLLAQFGDFRTQGAQFIEQQLLGGRGRCQLGFLLMGGLHGIDHHGDKQVEHHKGGNQDKRQEIHPRQRELLHHRAHDAHRPAFQRHHLE